MSFRALVKARDCPPDMRSFAFFGNALHSAAFVGNLPMCKLLIKNAGWNPNLRNHQGYTPLHQAVQWKQVEIVEYLVSLRKVDVNAKDDDGTTPLQLAVLMGSDKVVRALRACHRVQGPFY